MKISVIVPCYNIAPWLPNCLDSILNQTYQNLEIIVIDDGSTDGTGAIVDAYAARDARIVAVHQTNAGLVAVREKGIDMATGDYIGFVDGDDIIQPDMYERLMQNALKYNADISHCGISFVWPNGSVDTHYGTRKIIEQSNFAGIRDLLIGEQIEPSLCNKLYAKELVRNSCPDVTILNNEDLLRNFVLFSRSKKSIYEDFCGYGYIQRSGSISKDDSKIVRSFRNVEKARRLILENSTEEVFPYAIRAWLTVFVNLINQYNESTEQEVKDLCAECRLVLKREKEESPLSDLATAVGSVSDYLCAETASPCISYLQSQEIAYA